MRRRLAVGLIVLGSFLVAYAATVLLWRDSVADLYAGRHQERLDDALRVGKQAALKGVVVVPVPFQAAIWSVGSNDYVSD